MYLSLGTFCYRFSFQIRTLGLKKAFSISHSGKNPRLLTLTEYFFYSLFFRKSFSTLPFSTDSKHRPDYMKKIRKQQYASNKLARNLEVQLGVTTGGESGVMYLHPRFSPTPGPHPLEAQLMCPEPRWPEGARNRRQLRQVPRGTRPSWTKYLPQELTPIGRHVPSAWLVSLSHLF